MNAPSDDISPVDLLVLRNPQRPDVRHAMSVAVGALAFHRCLTAKTVKGRRWYHGSTVHFTLRSGEAELDDALAPVMAALRASTIPPEGLTAGEFVLRLQRAFGVGFGRYITNEIRPALVRRHLLRSEEVMRLGLFPSTRWYRTPRGDEALRRAEERIAAAEAVPADKLREPGVAVAMVHALGPLAVLVDGLREHARNVARDKVAAGAVGDLEDEVAGRRRFVDDANDVIALDWLHIMGDVDAAMDGFDAGAGDGGGGDGGGGE